MNTKEKSSGFCRIDKKWVKEENRIFTEYPGLPGKHLPEGLKTWLELARFYIDDLKWLLSLDNYKFWSHMIYSEKAHEIVVTFLKESPPNYMKNSLLFEEEVKDLFLEMEHLVFLIFMRLSTEEKSENFFIKNMGEIIYNNYLFSVPIILDICLIYGSSNFELVKTMINNVIEIAPYFIDDFQETIPYFINVFQTVKEKLFNSSKNTKLSEKEAQDLVLYLYDSVATIQIFFEVYPNVCRFFSKSELISELISFYSNVLPNMERHLYDNKQISNSFNIVDIVQNIRIDMLKITKNVFDSISSYSDEIEERGKIIDEYLTLMNLVSSEPVFFSDYNLMYSVEFEIQCVVANCTNVDKEKLNSVFHQLELLGRDEDEIQRKSVSDVEAKVMEIKSIFPDLAKNVIERWLNYYDRSTERLITAILENSIPLELTRSEEKKVETVEFKGKIKSRNSNFKEVLDDREEKRAVKEKLYLAFDEEDAYDDEYDDTYDENVQASEKDDVEESGRKFVLPRVLSALEKQKECDYDENGGDEEDEEDEGEGEEWNGRRDYFVENPAVVRERLEQARAARGKRDVTGRGRGQGQSKQVLRNRGLKEAHKSSVGNHNRKRGASRKLSRGMIPS